MNLFEDLPAQLPTELCQTLVSATNVRIERIVSQGHITPGFWYDQAQHEWVMIVRGAARIRFEDRAVDMKAGDYINIPAHQKHLVEWTDPEVQTVWLAVHYDAMAAG